ncbi:hypothetical protein AGMMS4952_00180 [Spirochaetia bacterium]|nr:hypothetical protein AGMMS4952_00180 [Spirochaetia bacterium]
MPPRPAVNTIVKYLPLRDVMNNLLILPEDTLEMIKAMIKTAANRKNRNM